MIKKFTVTIFVFFALFAFFPVTAFTAEEAAEIEEEAKPETEKKAETEEETKEKPEKEEDSKPELDPLAKAQEEAVKETHKKVAKLMSELDKDDGRHFMRLYTNYNLVKTVKNVQESVSSAVDDCGENNPEIEERMDKRFKEWNEAVNPVLDEANGNLDNMIIAQDYAKAGDIKSIFKSADLTRERTAARVEKIPVTSLEGCEFLLGKMDETQEKMVGLLRATLAILPVSPSDENGADSDPAAKESEL